MKIIYTIFIAIAILSMVGCFLCLFGKSNTAFNTNTFDKIATVLNLLIFIATIIMLIFVYKQMKSSTEQTQLLKTQMFVSNSISIAQVGDRCMWNTPHGGDYDSYLLLKEMEKDPANEKMVNAIRNQINRVEKKYKPVDMLNIYASNLKAIWKEGADPKKGDVWADIENVKLNNLLDHMEKRDFETENIKAAYFMSGVTSKKVKDSGKTWEDVFESLVRAMNNESWCLWGRKMALIAYCKLAEKQFPDNVFAFKEATDDWENRKEEILAKKNELLTTQSSGR